MATTEGEIKKSIVDYLRMRGHFVFNHYNGGIKKPNGSFIPVGMKGISDVLGIRKGHQGQFIAIEVKDKKGKVSEHQEVFLKMVNDMGGLGFVAFSIDDCIRNGL
jgi:hypothetical protein